MKTSKELMRIAAERSMERFPQDEIRPQWAWYSGRQFHCTVYLGDTLVLGTGDSMNACCDHLLEEIGREKEKTDKILVRYEYQS
jgi:hypothetical protein